MHPLRTLPRPTSAFGRPDANHLPGLVLARALEALIPDLVEENTARPWAAVMVRPPNRVPRRCRPGPHSKVPPVLAGPGSGVGEGRRCRASSPGHRRAGATPPLRGMLRTQRDQVTAGSWASGRPRSPGHARQHPSTRPIPYSKDHSDPDNLTGDSAGREDQTQTHHGESRHSNDAAEKPEEERAETFGVCQAQVTRAPAPHLQGSPSSCQRRLNSTAHIERPPPSETDSRNAEDCEEDQDPYRVGCICGRRASDHDHGHSIAPTSIDVICWSTSWSVPQTRGSRRCPATSPRRAHPVGRGPRAQRRGYGRWCRP
ncbi:hypothetical protein SVIRM249S_07082 [Streptomyces viridochromogenes]